MISGSPMTDYDSDSPLTYNSIHGGEHSPLEVSTAAPAAEYESPEPYRSHRRSSPVDPPPEQQPIVTVQRSRKRTRTSAGFNGSNNKRKIHHDETEHRRMRLRDLEAVVREHLGTGKFFLVAAALREIDEEKLYAPEKSIYTYAKNKFSFSRRTTNTYLCSASVYESLVEDSSLPVPVNISHIRSLHKFPAEVRRFIWKQVCESGQTITEEHVVAMTVKYETGISFTDLNNELYTPKEIITAGKHVINKSTFDLDPASCHFANDLHDNHVARHIYDEVTNGLTQPWHGDIWLSPPLGTDPDGASRQSRWFLTAESKFLTGEITSAMVLLKVDFGSPWFLRVQAYPHCLFHTKLSFSTPTGREKCLQDESHVLVYMGSNIGTFCAQFGRMGTIPGYNSWAYRPIGLPHQSSNISSPTTSDSTPNTPACTPSTIKPTSLAASQLAALAAVTPSDPTALSFLHSYYLNALAGNTSNGSTPSNAAAAAAALGMGLGMGIPGMHHPMTMNSHLPLGLHIGMGLNLMTGKGETAIVDGLDSEAHSVNPVTGSGTALDGIVLGEEDGEGRRTIELL
ncbi:uncharacterized protein SPPG_01607 [Spizellomyces punctatus DAOM BR117]|uniref:Uncharacterized protein n=1 Tax=Spizellomyces punctatus (strain DAOM BR117) TaxID=645134 RepID=A0A0L0HSU6_SPIPD|nr:hypothetical protein, variant [Spizellomyces punctatus DAOM BR117]XP_016612213.1 uncharacterized protein SPPG_01607 [Spizellomyces punctatus DAOM BR117]KND04173.1 hypothetical protein, variant [Spizellomyces punctatus DAOM BR117]KND04174.1 hypothetical protein SPPG_01607 [Spizellomyces punctatus DAOM BR117]|eukprot:XP_016612212.1 hypothetical protein, variant [Spizellomyces punctatus DAOM BR117]